MKTVLKCMVAGAIFSFVSLAGAQSPLRIITTDQPGGGMDSLIRPVAERIAASIGRPVIVDNKPGGQGRIAGQALLLAPADGNTVLITVQAGIIINPQVYKFPYDTLKDLVPVTNLGSGSLLLVVNPQVPVKNVAELVAWTKAQPANTLSYASFGLGTISHFGGVLLAQATGQDWLHVPYKASPDALKDVIPGNVPMMWDGPPTAVPLVKGGRLRALAYMGSSRLAALPEVPTIREAGFPAVENDGWIGVFAARNTSPAVVEMLQTEFAKALASPEIRARYLNFGFTPGGAQPLEFSKVVARDYDRWGKFIKQIGYTAE
jgi:tripartite-type tricarboxylate transporter receptor subunit TctC